MKNLNTVSAGRKTVSMEQKEKKLAVILIAPAVIYLILIMGLPLIWAVYTSLTDKVIGAAQVNFVGLSNYIEIIKDPVFQKSLLNTFIFAFFAVMGKVILGMIMALAMNQSTTSMAMFSVILVNIWRGTPFIAISVLAGLQNISPDLYEAASLDGANVIQRFLYVTLPSVKEVIILSAFVTTVWTLNDFEIVWCMTRGGPSHATELVSTYSYIQGFMNSNIAKSVAASLILVPILVVLVHYITKSSLSEE